MKVESIVFGPADLTRLLAAQLVNPIYRVQADITMDDYGIISAITAYPINADLLEITAQGNNYRIKGCPIPPDCMDIH